MSPKPQETKPLTWELIAIARSKSGVAAAIGCHKVRVALNTERKTMSVSAATSGGRSPRGVGVRNSVSYFSPQSDCLQWGVFTQGLGHPSATAGALPSTCWGLDPIWAAATAAKLLQSCPTLCDPIDGSLPGSRPWDSLGKNTGVGCHCLLQCMKVKSESEVAQSCPTLRVPMDCSLPGFSVNGIFQARVLEWVAIAFSV